jgi:flagellar hook-associated protein 2
MPEDAGPTPGAAEQWLVGARSMGSPVTFGGFNQIDFSMILSAIMEQERAPVRALEAQRQSLQSQQTAFATLAGRLSAVESAAAKLASASSLTSHTATTSDAAALAASAGTRAVPGSYDVVVHDLARSQTTASTSTHADRTTTIVANAGSLVINGKAVTIMVPATLEKLAEAINATADIGVSATVVSPAPGQHQLVLVGRATGSAGGFTIQNQLTGGDAPVTFGDADGNGISGDSPADNAQQASDARATVNNVMVTSARNTLDDVIPGVTLTLLKKDPAASVTVTVSEDQAAGKALVKQFVTAFNDLMKFASDQGAAAARGDRNNIGRDALLRALRHELRSDLSAAVQAGGAYGYLSQVGLGFSRTGVLELNERVFDEAMRNGVDGVARLFAGGADGTGAFKALQSRIVRYTEAGGLVPDARDRIGEQLRTLARRIDTMEARLAIRRDALNKEFIATDTAMSALNNSLGSLASLAGQYRLF